MPKIQVESASTAGMIWDALSSMWQVRAWARAASDEPAQHWSRAEAGFRPVAPFVRMEDLDGRGVDKRTGCTRLANTCGSQRF